jgi:hypothetical protein
MLSEHLPLEFSDLRLKGISFDKLALVLPRTRILKTLLKSGLWAHSVIASSALGM